MPSITEALHFSPEISRLLHEGRRQDVLQSLIAESLPPSMRPQRFRLKITDHRLTIFAPNQAFSAKLRQLKPTFKVKLQQAGYPFQSIHITISKNHTAAYDKQVEILKPELSPDTCERIKQLANRFQHLPKAAKALLQIAERTPKAAKRSKKE